MTELCNIQVRPFETGDFYNPANLSYPTCDAPAVLEWASQCRVCELEPSVTAACAEHAPRFGPAVVTMCACGRQIEKSEPVSLEASR